VAPLMQASVDWTGGVTLAGINSNGDRIAMDWNNGPSPMQIVLQCAGACSLVDLLEGVKGREVRSARVDMTSERADDYPRVFTKIHMTYHIDSDVPEKMITRLIEKSHEKYCSVGNMLKYTAEITWSLHAE